MDYTDLKHCATCNQDLPKTFFGINRKEPDHRNTCCSVCRRAGTKTKVEPPASRVCVVCNEEKPITKFDKTPNRQDGRAITCRRCKQGRRPDETKRHWAKSARRNHAGLKLSQTKRKLQLLQYRGGQCVDCGLKPSDDWPVNCFDFHHRDPNQKVSNVGNLIQKPLKAETFHEVDKCDILCANCHRRRHAGEIRKNHIEEANKPSPTQLRVVALLVEGWTMTGLPNSEAATLTASDGRKSFVPVLAMKRLKRLGLVEVFKVDEWGVQFYRLTEAAQPTNGDTCNAQPSAGVPSPSSGSPSGTT